ncbi:hypothetical protein JQS43_05085 [Natronosporangium hydrolyticum]|uniref:Uncharacterized protein n=1 Tax=Natronosporangium hydrolyticum TaxID=2811111 RepID=A0A895YI60_9ACTN|nr:hypothetical protein [Natronosporangium hydrolyticum]QSB15715.1 hypothetical protein JQS43_05085 [Natronosporangium hydrolyticum]
MEPFEKHRANVVELRTCGNQLLAQADEGLRNGGLTRQAYQPAIEHWDGLGAPELAAARDPLDRQCQAANGALAWASVVAHYWADQVETFNSEVDRIVSQWETDLLQTSQAGQTPEEIASLRSAVTSESRRRWWEAYNTHVLDGEDRVTAMLREGPTAEHVAEARRVGLIGGWGPTTDHFTPPGGGSGWFNSSQLALFAAGIVSGVAAPLLDSRAAGFAATAGHFRGLANGARMSWLMSTMVAMQHTGAVVALRQRGGGYYHPTSGRWVPQYWRARSGQVGAYRAAQFGRDAALHAAQRFGYQAVANDAAASVAQSHSSKWATAGKWVNRGGVAAAGASGTWDQWSRDAGRTDLDTGERVARSATRGAAVGGGAWAGAVGGAKTGAMVGAVLGPKGAVVGGLVGGVVGSGVGNMVADHAVDAVSAGWNGVKELGSSAGGALKSAGSAIGDGVKGLFGR